jgi:hypothetical protein
MLELVTSISGVPEPNVPPGAFPEPITPDWGDEPSPLRTDLLVIPPVSGAIRGTSLSAKALT